MAGKTGLKAKWRHLADLPHPGARHAQHGTPLPYAPRKFQLRGEGARGCTFGGNTLTPAMVALRSAAKSMYVYYYRTYEKAVSGGGEREKGESA